MDDEMKKLLQAAENIYSPGHVCAHVERVFLPMWRFRPLVWAITHAGPQQLDIIFLGLLRNGVTSRKEIANRLGTDKDEFVFSHLDALVREGYVEFSGEVYQITPKGEDFESGKIEEERIEKNVFPFIWGSMSDKIESNDIVRNPKGTKLNYAYPPDEDVLLGELVECFNNHPDSLENNLIFYSVDDSHGKRGFPYDRVYAEAAALFYKSKKDRDDFFVDLRVPDENDILRYRLCKELKVKANEEEYWREQFEKIYERKCKS